MTKIILLLTVALFTACSFDKNDPSADRVKQREEDRAKLTQQFDPVVGLYKGKLEFVDRPQEMSVDVELTLILEDENAGVDSDGLPIIRPALKGYFKRSDDRNLGLVFKASYNSYINPDQQNLILTNPSVIGEKTADPAATQGQSQNSAGQQSPSSSSSSGLEISSIRGKLINDIIESSVLSGGGIIGRINLRLVDRSAQASSFGAQADLNEKVLKLYKRIEGTYESQINIDGTALNPISVRVTLSATLNQTGKPVLKAYYERLDVYPVTDFNQELVVDYKTESYPQKISLVSASGSGFNFVGTVGLERVCGNQTCPTTLEGELVLSKNISTTVRFTKAKTRTAPENTKIIGRYTGKIKFNDRPNQNSPTVKLSIFAQDEVAGVDQNGQPKRRPVLKAYLQRSDNFSAGSSYSLIYNDINNPESYNLVIFNPLNPNLDIVSLRGKFNGTDFAAEVLTKNGVAGTVSLKWIDANPEAPSDNLDTQNSENLLKLYKDIEGSYFATVTVSTKDIAPFPIKVSINATMTTGNKPIIRGFYQRLDVPEGVLDLDLNVDYQVDTYPQKITMSSLSAPANGRVYNFDFDGVFRPQNPNTRVDCKAKENAILDDCKYRFEGTLLLPKNRRAEITLIRKEKKAK